MSGLLPTCLCQVFRHSKQKSNKCIWWMMDHCVFSGHLMSYGLAGHFSGMPSCCGVIHEFCLIRMRWICFRPSPHPRCLYSDSAIKIRKYLESSNQIYWGDAQLWAAGHQLTQPPSTAEFIQPLGLTQAGSLISCPWVGHNSAFK